MPIQTLSLPSFGASTTQPALPTSLHQKRIDQTLLALQQHKLDALVVYADREHSANLAYLTGFDPRFEEAVLILTAKGSKTLLVGNECTGYLPDQKLALKVELFQELSLMGQPRESSRPLKTILADAGITRGMHIGVAGWKYFTGKLIPGGPLIHESPSYLIDTLRSLSGSRKNVTNAGALFIDPERGLRSHCEPDQIACLEYAATATSDAILAALRHLKEGISELSLQPHFNTRGLTLSCHSMTSFGPKAARGLASPANNLLTRGDPFTMAMGLAGSLTARAGALVSSPAELPKNLRTFYPAFVTNYYAMVAAWYRSLKVGALAGDVFAAVEKTRNPKLLKLALNPGHLIHLDEWTHSPFHHSSTTPLTSGMALQADLIPISQGPFCTSNVEDGIVLADASLRAALAKKHPAVYARIQARRAFMQNTLLIPLHESVLPLSNTPAWLPPYALNLTQALTA
jgi:hypothetical protein